MQLDKKWDKLINGKVNIKDHKHNSNKIKLFNNKKSQLFKIN